MLLAERQEKRLYRLLIVDDEKIERNGIRFLLKQMDFKCEIEEAVNGAEALKLIREKDYDILLTDVKMPFMDGIELIGRVKMTGKDIRSVIFSGCNEFDYAKRAISLGVKDYILKPVDPKEFQNTLMKVAAELEEDRMESDLKSRSMSFMKEHALFQLLNGMELSVVLDESKGIVTREQLEEYSRIMLLEFNHEVFGKKDFDYKTIKEFDNLGISEYLNLNQQQSVLFFKDRDMDCVAAARVITEAMKKEMEEDCYVAISSELKSPEQIPNAMDEMELLMENKFYHPEIMIYYYNMEQNSGDIIQFEDDTLMKQMKQDIKMKDISGLKEHFSRFCAKYRNKTEYSQIYIKFLFSNLLKDIYTDLDSGTDQELNSEIERLYMVADFKAVMDIVNAAVEKLEKKYVNSSQSAHREVDVVKQYIYDHYGSEIGIDMLAEMVYMAPSYLSAVFKKETGQNLSKFIKAYRMEKAKDRLENSLAKIVDISNECGYANVSYFCSSFREYFGVSPQKFRENGGE